MLAPALSDDVMAAYEPVIGLEVHCQLTTRSKLFCGCAVAFGAPQNSLTCPVCLGLPGALPVLNTHAVTLALKVALALSCTIDPISRFDRKHYFYPDLPKGYQITQQFFPLATAGKLPVLTENGLQHVPIVRLHLEEDAGKSLHLKGERPGTCLDFNRAGVPLIEVVTAPALRSPAEARQALKALHTLVTSLGACEGNMEQGQLRCDANVSMRRKGETSLGQRVELKNLNSFRFIQQALEDEIRRQVSLLSQGERVEPQTRQWDSTRHVTRLLRRKETLEDYRYFPEPDLPPLFVSTLEIDALRPMLPELPHARVERYQSVLGLTQEQARVIASSGELARYFEAVLEGGASAKSAARWMLGDILGLLHRDGRAEEDLPIPPRALACLLTHLDAGDLGHAEGRAVLARAWDCAADLPEMETLVKDFQMGPKIDYERLARAVLCAHPDEVTAYQAGRGRVLSFLIGQMRALSGGRAEPEQARAALLNALPAIRPR